MRESEVRQGQDRLYTMRELNQNTANVLREINDDGRPAIITRHGRFIAAIVPLASAGLEGKLANKLIDEIEQRGQLVGEHTLDDLRPSSQVVDECDVNLPKYPNRFE